MRWPLVPFPKATALVTTTTALYSHCLGVAIQGAGELAPSPAVGWTEESKTTAHLQTNNASPDDFPVCTDIDGPFVPFCLPQDGADVVVDATYYVTWNADFYPLNASITIEMRYSNSTVGDSAFTSEKPTTATAIFPSTCARNGSKRRRTMI
ncbi:hypothetical protein AARAC_010207 [Aspergillus arachidicola]|uniref:Uncharacterized protein n=1 Tax=Aspergillus arachidicola TaxID=656916 RepID=A0A2G7EM23_9EURO|nr:hypothetical protein AARAC_010207 [Aspergillus arachidicola]